MTDPISVPTTMQKADLYSQKTIDRPTAKKEHPFHSIQKFKNDPNPDQSNTIVFQEREQSHPLGWKVAKRRRARDYILFDYSCVVTIYIPPAHSIIFAFAFILPFMRYFWMNDAVKIENCNCSANTCGWESVAVAVVLLLSFLSSLSSSLIS